MSQMFWMTGAGVMLGSVALGATLGGFAVGRWDGGLWDRTYSESAAYEDVGNPRAAYPDYRTTAQADGPTEPIVCKGCGPTLADRRMEEAERDAYVMGDSDPGLQAYEADAERWTTAETPVDPAPPERPAPHAVSTTPAALAVVVPAGVAPTLVVPTRPTAAAKPPIQQE